MDLTPIAKNGLYTMPHPATQGFRLFNAPMQCTKTDRTRNRSVHAVIRLIPLYKVARNLLFFGTSRTIFGRLVQEPVSGRRLLQGRILLDVPILRRLSGCPGSDTTTGQERKHIRRRRVLPERRSAWP